MEHIDPVELERRLREQLVSLMALSTAAEAEEVRREVVELAPVVEALDARVPQQWAVRRLYGYLDWRSRDTLSHEMRWLNGEQAAIDRALLSILDQSRDGRSPDEIRRARTGLDSLRKRIDQLETGAPRIEALHRLLEYTSASSAAALELAEFAERQRGQRAMERPTIEHLVERSEIARPQIEWER